MEVLVGPAVPLPAPYYVLVYCGILAAQLRFAFPGLPTGFIQDAGRAHGVDKGVPAA